MRIGNWRRRHSEVTPLLAGTYWGLTPKKVPHCYLTSTSEFFHTFFMRTAIADALLGWKIHLSIDKDHITKAWNKVIFPLLVKFNIRNFKIIRPTCLSELENENGRGKVVTLYLEYNPELKGNSQQHQQLEELLVGLEMGLRQNQIAAGPLSDGDAAMVGSQYIYYRHDGGKLRDSETRDDGVRVNYYTYLSPGEAQKIHAADNSKPLHNPHLHPDEFGLASINIEELLDERQRSCLSCCPR